MEFHEDKDLDARFRSRLADFKDSGYDRGHMVGRNPNSLWLGWLQPSCMPCTLEVVFTA